MNVFITNPFEKITKKLHSNQLADLKKAIKNIRDNPTIGELKVGDLAWIRVYKFHMLNQLTLLAYTYDERKDEITIIFLGPHENFYKDLKKQI